MDALLESLAVLRDERLERHRRPAAELLDQVIRAREDAVLVVDRDLAQVLEEEIIAGPARAFLPASQAVWNSSKSTCLYRICLPSTRLRTCAVSSYVYSTGPKRG